MRALSRALSARRLFTLILWLGLLIIPVHEVVDPDYWWHLRTGQYILQQAAVPHTDIYSFTSAGKEWIAHEWLSEVVMYATYEIAGHAGIILLFGVVVAVAFWIAYKRCEGKPFVAGFATLLGALASLPTLGARPQMFTVLFSSIFLVRLADYQHGGSARKLWWLVPAMGLWANLHAGFVAGLGLILLVVLGLALDIKSQGEGFPSAPRRLRPLLGVLLACVAVVAMNPNGPRLYSYPFETLRSAASNSYITEWASPDFHKLPFQFLALLILGTFTALAVSPRRPRPSDILLLTVTCYAALRSGRHIPLFALVAIPVLSEHVRACFDRYQGSDRLVRGERPVSASKALLNGVLVVLLLMSGVLRIAKTLKDQQAHEAERWPLAAVEFLRSHALPRELYNNYDWGGYIIWRLYPQYRVCIDGRADVHGDALVEKAVQTYRGTSDWNAFLAQRKIGTALIGQGSPLANLLEEACTWDKVYEDSQAVIFIRRDSGSSAVGCAGGIP